MNSESMHSKQPALTPNTHDPMVSMLKLSLSWWMLICRSSCAALCRILEGVA